MALVVLQSVMFFLRLLEFLIFVRVIMSWLLMIGSSNSFSNLIFELTEFMLEPARKLLNKTPLGNGFIDFSPILVCFVIEFLKSVVINAFSFFIFY